MLTFETLRREVVTTPTTTRRGRDPSSCEGREGCERCETQSLEGLLGRSSHDLDTWLITMVIVSPLRIGLWDPL